MSKVYNEVKKKRQHVHARSVVELHFWNSQSNAPLEIPLSLLAGKGPQFFLDELLNHAMTHISFDEEQMELLSLHFIFRGRRLNYNGIKFIEQNAEKMPVTIIHVELNFNYEKVWSSFRRLGYAVCPWAPCVYSAHLSTGCRLRSGD